MDVGFVDRGLRAEVIGWLRRLWRGSPASKSATTHLPAQPLERTAEQIAETIVVERGADFAQELAAKAIIARSIQITALMTNSGREVDFVLEAYQRLGDDFMRRFRMEEPILSKAQLRGAGLSANTKFSAKLFDLLSDQGRADPVEAAGSIARTICHTRAVSRDLGNTMNALGLQSLVKLLPSNMLVGPCAAAAHRAGAKMRVAEAPLLPLMACDRPGQCACRYRLEFEP